MSTISIFCGAIIDPQSLTEYTVLPRALLAVDPTGTIAWIEREVDSCDIQKIINQRLSELKASFGEDVHVFVTELQDGEFILPGLVDTHTHAPQVPNMGSGQQYELLDWLENVTFPMESRFRDAEFAKMVYPEIVRRFIAFGTTTCCYYGTLHLESTKVLADTILKLGQRALVGKCNMDRNCPDYYREPSAGDSLKSTKELIAYIRSLNSDLIHPVLTPRFAISCTSDLLRGLGDMARSDETLAIQTHIAENKGEIAFTKDLFNECKSYADVYDSNDLLCERTILAHAVHLDDHELDLVKKTGAGISHCPTSNFNLRSGMANIGEMLDRGIKVGLGSDVSGGFSPSIVTAIQHASMCSKMVALQIAGRPSLSAKSSRFAGKQLPIATLLYLATLGGASLCCMENKIGSFAPGKSFDALIVSVRPETGNPAIWSMPGEFSGARNQTEEEAKKRLDALLEQFLFGGDDRNILKVFVQGKCIGGTLLRGPLKN
ncbi:hypothetical protein ACEPAF_4878 [Sanghuangporus sanghuang]